MGIYLGHFTDGCVLQNPIPAVIINKCLSFLMAGKCSGENLPLPEHKHIEILDWGGLWKVDNNVAFIFKVAECHFQTITSVPTTKIDCKSIVSTFTKNPIIHKNMSKIRSKSGFELTKKKRIAKIF